MWAQLQLIWEELIICGWRVGMVTAKQGGADHKRGGQVGIVTAKLGGADHNRWAGGHSYS